MAPDATEINTINWIRIRNGTHQISAPVPSPTLQTVNELDLQPRLQEPQLEPCYEEPQPQPTRHETVPLPEPKPMPQPTRHEPVPLPEPNPQPLPRRQVPQTQPRRRDHLLGINPVLDLGVYSTIGIRSGYRRVMGKSGSRRRRAAKVGAIAGVAVAAGATIVAGATVVGGILVVKAIL